MKMLRFQATLVLFGLFSACASSGAPKVPPQERPKMPTSKRGRRARGSVARGKEEAQGLERLHAAQAGAQERVL